MAWLQIQLDEQQYAVVNDEREGHPDAHFRRKMLALWLLAASPARRPLKSPAAGGPPFSVTSPPIATAVSTACVVGMLLGRSATWPPTVDAPSATSPAKLIFDNPHLRKLLP